jgi:hypothetical protein
MFGFSIKEIVMIMVIAFVGVWLIDKALSYSSSTSKYAINSPN